MATAAKNKQAKRMKILDAAYDLFIKNGINTTPIDEVVKKAGVAKGTFYLYFNDRHDLIDQLTIYRSAMMIKDMIVKWKQTYELPGMSFTEKIISIADLTVVYLKDNKELIPLIDKNLTACFNLLSDSSGEFKEAFDGVVELFLNEGYTDERAKRRIYMIAGMISSACSDAILNRGPYPLDEITDEIHMILNKLLIKEAEPA